MPGLTNSPHYAAFKDTVSLLVSDWNDWLVKHPYIVASQLLIGSILFLAWLQLRFPTQPTAAGASKSRRLNPTPNIAATVENTTMQAPAVQLEPPKDTPFTVEELKEYDGAHDGKGIYVAIKGTIFDVSAKKDMYGPGGGYHVFTGKDASVALGKSSLKPEDAIADYSRLDESEMGVLNDWFKYFEKRYNIVGKVVDESKK